MGRNTELASRFGAPGSRGEWLDEDASMRMIRRDGGAVRGAARGATDTTAFAGPLAGALRRTTAALVCAGLLAGTSVLTAHAQEPRTVADGVYSDPQAGRGRQIYQEQCVTCHGDALEGSVGPPLAGDGFLAIWSGLPVVDLVDKIHNTMPAAGAGAPVAAGVDRPDGLRPAGRRLPRWTGRADRRRAAGDCAPHGGDRFGVRRRRGPARRPRSPTSPS